MNNIKLKNYTKIKMLKINAVTTGINIEKRHKIFLELNGVNLSALVRDVIDNLIKETEKNENKKD